MLTITPEQLEAVKALLMQRAVKRNNLEQTVDIAKIFTDGSFEEYARLVASDYDRWLTSEEVGTNPWRLSNSYATSIVPTIGYYELWWAFNDVVFRCERK